MYLGKSIEDVVEKTHYDSANRHDILVPAKDLRFFGFTDDEGDVSYRLKLNGSGPESGNYYPLSRHTESQMCNYLDIPGNYYKKLTDSHADLLQWNVNTLLKRSVSNRIIRTLDGGARAFLSDRYSRIDNHDVLLHTFQAIQNLGSLASDYTVASCDVVDHALYLKIIFPRIKGEVALDDIVEAGVLIRNNEVGAGSTSVRGFVNRLVCTNGIVSPVMTEQPFIQRHSGPQHPLLDDIGYRQVFSEEAIAAENKALLLKLKDVVAFHANPDNFEKIVDMMKASTKDRINGDPRLAVEVLGNYFSMSSNERDLVLTRLLQFKDMTRWGVVNAITEASKNAGGYYRATQMEEFGGQVLAMPRKKWQAVAEARNTIDRVPTLI